MGVDEFGDSTEAVRECALNILLGSAEWLASDQNSTPTIVEPSADQLYNQQPIHSVICSTTLCAPPGQASSSSSSQMLSSPIEITPSAAASTALQSCDQSSQAVLASEVDDISKAVEEFLNIVPRDLLLHEPSALPDEDRIATRRRHLLQCGASSIRAGTAFVKHWLAFCSHRHIPRYGLPVDADTMNAFLSAIDAEARRRSAGKAKQTGASVQHSMACAARWVSDHAGLPFAIAKQQCVRKASAPVREHDPSWSEAWEAAILLHLLRVALRPGEAPLIRAYAASTYMVCVASLRLVNGLRSAPPVPDSSGTFHGVAALSKGRRRSSMAPKPWSVPSTSPDPAFSDHEVSTGLRTALNFLPPNSCSMFPCLLDNSNCEVSLERAVSASATTRATDAKLITSITFVLTLSPLHLSRAEARSIASRKHGPRHILPEVGRLMGLPEAARNELGLWAGLPKGRTALPNRYSRDAERLLSKLLRSLVLLHIRSRMPSFRRVDLEHFAASPTEMQLAFDAAQHALQRAEASVPLASHSTGGGAISTDGNNTITRTIGNATSSVMHNTQCERSDGGGRPQSS